MPLSTNIPNANTNAKSTIMFNVTPAAPNNINDRNIDIGMAIPTKSAFLRPKKNISTSTTNSTPKMMLFSKFETCVLVSLDMSFVLEIIKFDGKRSSFAFSKIASILSDAFIKFSPPRLMTSSITTG